MKATVFLRSQKLLEDSSSSRIDTRVWRNLWDAVFTNNPYWGRELVLKYKLSDEDIKNPENVHPDRKVEIVTLLQTYLSQITPDVDYGLGAEKK